MLNFGPNDLSKGNRKQLDEIKSNGNDYESFLKNLKRKTEQNKIGSISVQNYNQLCIQEVFYKDRKIIIKFATTHVLG